MMRPDASTPGPLHVEFLGVPGAGKSSLLRHVEESLRREHLSPLDLDHAVVTSLKRTMHDRMIGGVMKVTPRGVGTRALLHLANRSQDRVVALRDFILAYPHVMPAVIDAIQARRDRDLRQDLLLAWILELMWRFQIGAECLSRGDSLVIDEGFVNRAISVFGHNFSPEDETYLAAYLHAIPLPDIVVAVSRSPQAAALTATDRRRYKTLDADGLLAYTESAARCVEAVTRILVDLGVPVLTVRNDGPLGESGAIVESALKEWLHAS